MLPRTHDRQGRRIDYGRFPSLPITRADAPFGRRAGCIARSGRMAPAETGWRHQVRRGAILSRRRNSETGHLCPITMTSALAGGADGDPETVSRMGAARHHAHNTTRPQQAADREDRADARHGHDGEDRAALDVRANVTPRRAGRQRLLPHHRPKMVHVGADVRTPSSYSRRRARGCPASWCRASSATGPATVFVSSG